MKARLRLLLLKGSRAAAPELLGWRLRSELAGLTSEVVISEVEAYGGPEDEASHACRGPSARNASMFAGAGTLYVYRSYGVHWCANVVTGPVGDGQAVLIRGGVPTIGEAVMADRRGRSDHLTDGPGKLCQALAITGEHDGSSLFDGPIRLVPPERPVPGHVVATPRIGISKAKELPWRFVLER